MKNIKSILEGISSQGKMMGSRGSSFRDSSSSSDQTSGLSIGASRAKDHEDATKDASIASEKARENEIKDRNREAEQRQKETMQMSQEEAVTEAKMTKKFVFDKPNKSVLSTYSKLSTEHLQNMHDRWVESHKRDLGMPKRAQGHDQQTSDGLLAADDLLKKRGVKVQELPEHPNLGMVHHQYTDTKKREEIKKVARMGSAKSTSPKSILPITGEIKTKIVEEKPTMSLPNFGLSASLIAAARQIVEKKDDVKLTGGNTPVETSPETNDDTDNDEDTSKEKKTTDPKTKKEKELAALASPKDKITHKDVLVGRGVLNKEEVDLEEAIKIGSRVKVHAPGKDYHGVIGNVGEIDHGLHKKSEKKYTVDYNNRSNSVTLPKSQIKLHKEEVELDEVSKWRNGPEGKTWSKTAHADDDDYAYTKDFFGGAKEPNIPSHKATGKVTSSTYADKVGARSQTPATGPRGSKAASIAAAKKLRDRSGVGFGPKSKLPEEVEFSIDELARIDEIAQSIFEIGTDGINPNGKQKGMGDVTNAVLSDEKKPEMDDQHKHPMQQLEKIAHSVEGREPSFEHKDGSKTKVGKTLARQLKSVHDSMKTTQEKNKFADSVHASRDSMRAAADKHL
jgi:hypothetical protein